MHFYKSVFLGAILLIGSNIVFAQASSPEELAKEYFNALQTEGVSATWQFMHPQSLLEFKEMFIPIYEAEAASKKRELIDLTFGKTANVATLKQMEPLAFMNGVMSMLTARLGDMKIHFDKIEVLGTVSEGETRHVVTRITTGIGEMSVIKMEVLSLVPYNETWRMQLNAQVKGLASTLRAKFKK